MDIQLTAQMGQQPPRLPPGDRFQVGVLSKLAQAGQQLAEAGNQPEVNTAHLLGALGQCGDDEVRQILERYDLGPERVEAELRQQARPEDQYQVFVGQVGLSQGAQAALQGAVQEAEQLGHERASFGHILMALLLSGELSVLLARLAEARDAAREELKTRLEKQRRIPRLPEA